MSQHIFLIDSGASISCIFAEYLNYYDKINTSQKIKIKGVSRDIKFRKAPQIF